MFVCICHELTDRDIEAAAAKGIVSAEALFESRKLEPGCEICHDEIEQMLAQCRPCQGKSRRA